MEGGIWGNFGRHGGVKDRRINAAEMNGVLCGAGRALFGEKK